MPEALRPAAWRVLVTRTREQSSVLAGLLRAEGVVVLEVPLIRIEAPESYAALDRALDLLDSYDTLLVTSANTARVLVARRGAPWCSQPFTVAIGPATAAALLECGLRVDLEPVPAVAEAVAEALVPTAAGKRFLLARAATARDVLPHALRAAGALVDVVEAYRTVPAEESKARLQALFAARAERVDVVTFTSSSTVHNFFRLLGKEDAGHALRCARACSIGPITSATLREYGVEPATEAARHDVAGLAEACARLLKGLPGRPDCA